MNTGHNVGTDTQAYWQSNYISFCNAVYNERELRLLGFVCYNNLVLTNTLAAHKASRRWTWHAPNGQHRNQIDYTMVQNRFRSSIKRTQTRSFPGADVGSDHAIIMMNFRLRLNKIRILMNTRIKFDLEKLKDPRHYRRVQSNDRMETCSTYICRGRSRNYDNTIHHRSD